jgi:rod shape-determining protein MreD
VTRALWTAVAVLAALLVQSALSQLTPLHARDFDPFLLVLVYCGLTGGETHGMLAGAAAGWVQDVHFGGTVVGLSGLTKLIVGFGVGVAGARFNLSSPASRLLVLFVATLVDAILFARLASVFDVKVYELPLRGLAARATLSALAGAVLYELVDRRRQKEARA